MVLLSSALFLAAAPFAKTPLAQVWAFFPIYQSALVVNDLITSVLLYGQFAILRTRALLVLASAYLFSAFMAVVHGLSFPGLFAPAGVLGGGPQTTAWVYFLWHAGFPILVITYALLKHAAREPVRPGDARGAGVAVLGSVTAVFAAVLALALFTTSGHAVLPAIMQGNQDAPAKVYVATASWMLSLAALPVLWRRRPHSLLDLWLMVVMCVWVFDIALASVLNGGRFDLGWYSGRVYGLLAASFVLIVLLLENSSLHGRLVDARETERRQAEDTLARHAERLRILNQIDQAMAADEAPEAIAAAVIEPLRELLGVPRAIVNRFDLAAGEVEWIAAAGRRRTHVGPGVRYSIRLMGDLGGLKRGESQRIDVHALPPGPEAVALLASGVHFFMAVPMIAGGELIGALSFGGEADVFPAEKVQIAQEVATQLAIAITQARLLERVKRNAEELEIRVRERTSALEALNRELDDLYNNAPCGYHSVDGNGLFVRMNETELKWLGYSRDEVIGKMGPADLHTPESLEIYKQRFPAFQRTGVSSDVEYEFRRKDGTLLPVVLNATAVRDRDGRFLMSRSTIFDNTERKRAAEQLDALNASLKRHTAQLESANKELESFSYSVSHDLRSPLRAIDGFSRIVQEDHAGKLDAEGQRLLGVIRDNSRKMAQLIDDLLEYSRLGRKPLSTGAIDMNRLVEEVLGELQVHGEKPPKLVLGALPPARGDATLLKQVWTNLLANAIKFSVKREHPVIEVSGHENGAECVYCVKDNGAGFDMKYYDKLFGVFQRLHSEEQFEGTGVGLAIVQRVVFRHGGRVWAEGKVDEGAAFYFSLPQGGGA